MKPEPSTTYKSYVKDALRTESNHLDAFTRLCADPRKLRLIHAVFGLCTEVGELQDQVKRHLFYGANLDLVNLREECGDLFWYLALLADVLGEANFTNMLQKNIEKLRERYPEKFEEKQAINRNLTAERKVLERDPNVVRHHFVGEGNQCTECGHFSDHDIHV